MYIYEGASNDFDQATRLATMMITEVCTKKIFIYIYLYSFMCINSYIYTFKKTDNRNLFHSLYYISMCVNKYVKICMHTVLYYTVYYIILYSTAAAFRED